MKLSLTFLSIAMVPSYSLGFVLPPRSCQTTTALSMAKRSDVDSTEAIKEALAATKKFGATSTEARLAWATVEEMDSSDNSVAYQGSLESSGDSSVKEEYDAKIRDLKVLLAEQSSKVGDLKKLAEEIRAVKLAKPTKSNARQTESDAMRDAIAGAREATEKYGVSSSEAALAWEAVEEIASNDMTAATLGVMSEEDCLVETIEACEALEELNRVLNQA